jgi:hypothetical protein
MKTEMTYQEGKGRRGGRESMKRIILVLAIILMVLPFIGCGAGQSPQQSSKNTNQTPNSSSPLTSPSEGLSKSYLIQVSFISQQIQQATRIIAKSIANPDLSYIPEDVWSEVNKIKIITADFVTYAPTNGEQLQSLLVSGCQRYSWAMDYLKDAATGSVLDTDKIAEAISLMDSGNEYLTQASRLSLTNGEILSIELFSVASFITEEKARLKKQKPPLEFVEAWIQLNIISNPEARVVVRNVSNRTVDAYTLDIYCYDRFDTPVNDILHHSNQYPVIAQKTIGPGGTYGYNSYWTLHSHETTTKIHVVLVKVHFTDGDTWTPAHGQEVSIDGVLNE